MQKQKILVTGGAGFIGSHLVDKLIEFENQVTVIDSLVSGNQEFIQDQITSGKCIFIKGDIRNSEIFNDISGEVDYIFHLAADPDVKTSVSKPVLSFEHNVRGTLNVLEYARVNKPKGFIFASSGGTLYGDVDKFPITEESLLQPISPYGASKAAGEIYIGAYANAYNFKAVSGRYANIFGERSMHGVSFDFYHKLKKNPKELTILGNGMQKKSYLHVSDCVNATILIGDNLNKQKKWYDYYNIGSEEWFTVKELASVIESQMGLENVKHKFTGGEKGWVGDVHKLLLSIEKIKEIGWSPKISFEEAMHRYVEYLEKI
ncbi:MAG: NAD-dependent epimerase/dehydratase family protein [Candidatus Lokiarchaeota archaeon]|nr:NAD-dependent epimerase/dehydratase family protein [Candidatus Lokiarchaeota archaeon]